MMPNDAAPEERPVDSFAKVSLGIRILMLATFLLMGLKIIGYDYLPAGDLRRDAAQAISGKPFTEILVLFPGYTMNHNPGWDCLLRQLHVKAGMTEDALVAFAVVAMSLCLLCAPLPWLRCPEAWLASVLAFALAMPGMMIRFMQGRPFLLTEGILVALLLAWYKGGTPSWTKIALSTAGIALAAWMHGTWFLWVLLPFAFFLAREWRAGFWLTICWGAGTIAGALLTGRPFESLRQSVVIAATVAREHAPERFTVGELQSSAGVFVVLLILAVMFIWRQGRSDQLFRSPLFWMMAVSWILGLNAGRFWDDWGLPAALVWLALQFEEVIAAAWSAMPVRRLVVAAMLALSLFRVSTSDLDGRYTNCQRETYVDGSDPRLKGWMPDKGGIFYGADMVFFYNTFYKNPEGDWRYIVGFEPAWMPAEDLKVFRKIQWNQFAWPAYEPWAKKMRPEDRLEISSGAQPVVPPLEWINAGGGIWIGRLPRSAPANR
jgi:hypothetical protein